MNLLYTCIFDKLQYLQLLELLLISGIIFGDIQQNNIDFLIITTDDFKVHINEIFNKLRLTCKIYTISLNNIYIALSARFYIFDYTYINDYNKILYIDIDILITNSLKKLFDLILENKIYVLSEGTISDDHHGKEFFSFSKIKGETTAFTSGIILFNNCEEVKNLFMTIIDDINVNITFNHVKPSAYDQAFLNYHAITNNKYNNTLLIDYAINNPTSFDYKYVLCHFPGGVGNFSSKFDKMSYYLLYLYDTFNYSLINNDICYIKKKYAWKHDNKNVNGYIEFNENNELSTTWGKGTYEILNGNYVKTFWFKDCHLLIFYDNFNKFISIRRMDNNISSGESIVE
jgi:lipopolysaccharide biosynthesis glycosyltransferase